MSNREPIDMIKQAIQNGMDLSHIKDITKFKKTMYKFLTNKHFCYEDFGKYVVGTIYDDVAIVEVEDQTLRIVPIMQTGFFDILMNLFKFYSSYEEEKKKVLKVKNIDFKNNDDDEEFWV